MPVAARAALVVALTVAVVSCGDDDDAKPATTESSSITTLSTTETTTRVTAVAPETTASPSTVLATAAPSTTVPLTTTAPSAAAAVTTEACPTITSTDPVNDGFPMQMSSLVGADIRTGAHPCFERIVLELGGEGEMPGYLVGYEDDPIKLSPSDQTVEIAGDATLVLRAAAWMTTMEGEGYQGATDIVPTNVDRIVELRMLENFEGMCVWAIGLDERRPFTVVTLAGPPRIVIDIATS